MTERLEESVKHLAAIAKNDPDLGQQAAGVVTHFGRPPEPAYFQHEFQILECATEFGTPKVMVTFSRGVNMDDVLQDALEGLRVLLESAQDVHPGMRLSLNVRDWDLQLLDVHSPIEVPGVGLMVAGFPIKNRLVWNLGLRKGALWTEQPVEAVA